MAILDDTLFMATVDAHLVAVDAKNGEQLWDTKVGEAKAAYAMTLAPLAIKDKVIVGVAGAEYGIRGYIAAYDAKTGKEAWKAYTIPGPGEPGHDTWPADGWEHGGASVWTTGSYDPELNLTYWGIGNPGPDFNAAQREGDNLYSDSVVALDADTGKLKWHFQFTPERSVRLRLHTGAGARRRELERQSAQADALGQSQRFLLRPRSRDGTLPAGTSIHEGELGERAESDHRSADPDATTAGPTHVPRSGAARPTGTRRRTAPAPGCSICQPGKTIRPCLPKARGSLTRRGRTSREAT